MDFQVVMAIFLEIPVFLVHPVQDFTICGEAFTISAIQ